MSSTPIRRILMGVGVFAVVCGVAIAGYIQMGWSVSDAVYMVVITIFGVGYGEVKPIESTQLRSLTIGVIVFGYGAAVYTVGGFIQLLIDGELQNLLRSRKVSQGIASLRGHVIVCGYGRMGSIVAEDLTARGMPFVVIDAGEARVSEAHSDKVLSMIGNATDEDTLREAGIEHARALATLLPDDATNGFICLTARDLNRSLEIISRGESRTAEKRLRRCGADHVVMAASIGAKRATQLLVRPTAASVLASAGSATELSEELSSIGLQMDELKIQNGSLLVGKPVSEIEFRGNRGFLIVAIRHADGETVMNPAGEHPLSVGDTVIVVGHTDDIVELCASHTLSRQKITYRGATY
ncbi:MAG: potassium channel protein [Planctomycetota bacterium]